MAVSIERLQEQISACRLCLDHPAGRSLPHPPRPVAVLSDSARIAICGQAPGVRVHRSGVPFTDPSGDRLRQWMAVDLGTFYDRRRIAIVPMGFCFPGQTASGADLPPRKECAPRWHDTVFAAMPQIELLLAVGLYAQKWHLGTLFRGNVHDTVADWRGILAATGNPRILPLPHPSWRNNAWLTANPWFERDVLPALRRMTQELLREPAEAGR